MCITRIADRPALPIARVSAVVFLLCSCVSVSVSRTRLGLTRRASLRSLCGVCYHPLETLRGLLFRVIQIRADRPYQPGGSASSSTSRPTSTSGRTTISLISSVSCRSRWSAPSASPRWK